MDIIAAAKMRRKKYLASPKLIEEMADSAIEEIGLTWDDLKNVNGILDIGADCAGLAVTGLKNGIKITSLEIDPDDMALNFVNKHDIEYVVGDAFNMPFDDNVFELAISIAAIPADFHTRKQVKKLFREIRRVLKPGGEFRVWPLQIIGTIDDSYFQMHPVKNDEKLRELTLNEIRKIEPHIERISSKKGEFYLLRV